MRREGERGVALIAVLWALALLSIIAASVSLEMRTSTRIAHNVSDQAAAREAAAAGVQRAILDLVTRTGDGEFRADGTTYVWSFASSAVRISLQDERGKINLNEAPEPLLAALFASVGVDPGRAQSLADAVADFRDPDNFLRPHGAEAFEYQAAGLIWGPKNAPFQALDELQQVLGVTPNIYRLVAPYLTIYSAAGEINPAVASPHVTEILRQADLGSDYFVRSPGNAYSIRAEAKSSNGAMFVREAVVQLTPQETVPVQILAWRQGAPTNSREVLERHAGNIRTDDQ